MNDYSREAVLTIAAAAQQKEESEMRMSSLVREAQRSLDSALADLARDKHNAGLQQDVRDARAALFQAQNSYHKKQREMALALAKAERDHKVAEEQRVYAAQAEAAAKADMLPAWLQSGGTKENFNAAWPRMWEEELIRRSREHEGDLKQRMLVATDNSGI